MLQGSLIILAFVIIAALMMTKKIPTLLALPLMAVVICLIAGVPAVGVNAEGTNIGWLQTVLEAGTVRMGSAIMAVVFGAWLGQLMNKTGVTENIIKKSAELGGDRPLVVTLIMVAACAVLFTTLSGLGSIIMVGSIAHPDLRRCSRYERGLHFPDGVYLRPDFQHRQLEDLLQHFQPGDRADQRL